MSPVRIVGVIGAGTMGAGIAQLAAQAGMETRLHDPIREGLEKGMAQIAAALERSRERGRLSEEQARGALARVEATPEAAGLRGCELVIEAAPERLEIKLELFRALDGILDPGAVVATNTSSLSVSELATAFQDQSRLVGLHFFNPAPVMRLAEVVAGQASSAEAIAAAREVGEAMGKRVIEAADIPGFIVNRCNRPFSLESLRVLQSGLADVEQIDRIARMQGGFRMGPFELMDLIGLETNHAVAEGFYRQTYGEPRYQPSPLQARMVASGRLGRKTGAGWYEYGEQVPPRASDPEPPAVGGGDDRRVAVLGELPVADALRGRIEAAGFALVDGESGASPWLTLVCGVAPASAPSAGPRAVLCAGRSLHAADPSAAGFHLLPPLDGTALVEVTETRATDPESRERLAALAAAIGCHAEPVGDGPGLVLGRVVCQLINEAAFLIGEGNGTAADIDAGMELGVNHPRGPVAWSRELGLAHVVAVLDGLHRELGEERYRVAPLLRQGLATGAGGLDEF